MPPKIKALPKHRNKLAKGKFEKKADPKSNSDFITDTIELKQSYLERLLNSDYIKNLPYAIAGIVITGLATKYVIGTDRINPTSAEAQIINNLTSAYMHDYFFDDVADREREQIFDTYNRPAPDFIPPLQPEEETKDDSFVNIRFYNDPNRGDWF
jgi:hypothetical protein